MIEEIPRRVPRSYKRDDCRLCSSRDVQILFSLAPTPPAEWYFSGTDREATSVAFPLDLYFCGACKHVQLLDVIDPEDLFSRYFYESKSSPGLIEHFAEYAKQIFNLSLISSGDLVIDIGSNDGTLLANFNHFGFKVVGIEPSQYLSKLCNDKGLYTYNSFLDSKVANQVIEEQGLASLICANNVFAHNDDLSGMAECVSKMLKEGGFFVFEVSSLLHTMKGKVIDYIYHEHLSYHSLIALEPFLAQFSLSIFDVEIVNTKGGSYRVYAKKSDVPVAKSKRLIEAIRNEFEIGLGSPDFYLEIYEDIMKQKESLRSYLLKLDKDSVVVGYGASATTTTLSYEFGLTKSLDYLVDDNSIRHGNFLPGTNIEVHSPERLRDKPPTHVIILAWRFSQMILDKISDTLPKDTIFIVPLPEFQIVEKGI